MDWMEPYGLPDPVFVRRSRKNPGSEQIQAGVVSYLNYSISIGGHYFAGFASPVFSGDFSSEGLFVASLLGFTSAVAFDSGDFSVFTSVLDLAVVALLVAFSSEGFTWLVGFISDGLAGAVSSGLTSDPVLAESPGSFERERVAGAALSAFTSVPVVAAGVLFLIGVSHGGTLHAYDCLSLSTTSFPLSLLYTALKRRLLEIYSISTYLDASC